MISEGSASALSSRRGVVQQRLDARQASLVVREHPQRLVLGRGQRHLATRHAHPALLVADLQIAQHVGLGRGLLAKRGPDPCRELRRREGLDDVVGRPRLERPHDGLVAPVGGDEDDRPVGELGNALHQLDAVGPGQHQVEQDQPGIFGPDEAGQCVRIARHHRDVLRACERVAHEPQRLRIVVDHQDGHRLPTVPGDGLTVRGTTRRGLLAGLAGHRHRECDLRALARPAAGRADAPPMRLHEPLADGEPETRRPQCAVGAAACAAGVLAEQLRQPLGRHTPALVAHRDRDVHPVMHRGDPDGRGLRAHLRRRSRAGCSAPARCAAGRPSPAGVRAAGR